jgi:sugar phosphate isomerase/epimerase
MVPGFHCESLPYHDPAKLIPRLAELGFRAIALRPRRGGWDVDAEWFQTMSAGISAAAKEHEMAVVIDLDSPFYDDPDRYETASLASEEPAARQAAIGKIQRWIELTQELCPVAITYASGRVTGEIAERDETTPPEVVVSADEGVLERLASAIKTLLTLASPTGVQLALRPVAGNVIGSVAHFERFGQWLDNDSTLGLAADVGEMLLAGEFPIGARLARLKDRLTCVYLCEPDLERGCDQRFGQGDIDMARVWEVMTQSGFAGPGIFRSLGHSEVGLELAVNARALIKPAAD